MAAHTIVGLGEALWDLLPTGKHLGGAPLNFAYIASLLGDRALVATRLGDDTLGGEMSEELSRRNLDLSGIQTDRELPTGTVQVRFQNGQPEYEILRPAAWDTLEWTPQWRKLAAKTNAVCFGTLAQRDVKSRDTILKFLANTAPDCLRVFDINLRKPFYSRDIIESSLQLSTILKLNDVELPQLNAIFGIDERDPVAQMRAILHRFGLKMVFVTRGERGAMATNGVQTAVHDGFSVKVSDTIGAGDAFTAAAVHCILRQMDLNKTLATANKWASWVASQAGGMPQISEELRLKMLNDAAARAS